MLDVLITSRVRKKIIQVYASFPGYKTHIRGLATLIKEDVGNVYRELRRLERVGFLLSSRDKNTKIYSVNRKYPFFKELQMLVLKWQSVNRSRSGPVSS